ncbi:peptidoglycan editing factor PgeF [Chelativorans sp. Marseille-P2723]|uniref:peptidoglycan editing factor PgeF n=1 Tax=Chelativorans sp. Marseille-P2723 TaxID=2709133 RepID=UPI001570385A|nr:peptidoglycan editing factor PgeF [Chelativorans sp. Marseille-P2723]
MLDQPIPEPLRSPLLDSARASGVRHGFFTRAAGVSEGIYHSLNVGLGSGDHPEKVHENRRRVAARMGGDPHRLITVHQCHSADAIVVETPFRGSPPRADAMVTASPGLVLGVLTADCGPVLLADDNARVIGAAHAGWKGAFTGVLENTVAAMERLGAQRERIIAVLGPSISQANYEVGAEFVERFTTANPENERYFRASFRTGHAFFDLNLYTLHRLERAGVRAHALGRCTYTEEECFFSYRRSVHRNEPDYGRQISAIALEEF